MKLSKIKIENYRLFENTELDIDEDMTLIVGKNNTAKTSCFHFIENAIKGKPITYNDYPITRRSECYELITQFIKGDISYDELKERLKVPSIEFTVDYAQDGVDDPLGNLSPFIIDINENTTKAIIIVRYEIDKGEEWIRNHLKACYEKKSKIAEIEGEIRQVLPDCFSDLFNAKVYAVNPDDKNDRLIKSTENLISLFEIFSIPAERELGEDASQKHEPLSELISDFLNTEENNLDPRFLGQITRLRNIIKGAERSAQDESKRILSDLVNCAVGFGYPNSEELQLGVATKLGINDQLKYKSELTYTTEDNHEYLPSPYNGLGYKNLLKMELLMALFAKKIESLSKANIPLLLIEEPESHMHPQMQQAFAKYLKEFLGKISSTHVQVLLTSHSSHIVNASNFFNIRYAQKNLGGVVFKNLRAFIEPNKESADFIKKYLTINRCDLFFADKVILIEGAAERLLIPHMISKCDESGLFAPKMPKLSEQYYALIEVGGAYAYLFMPLIEFLGIPCLILTDIDPITVEGTATSVSEGAKTSNTTIKRWLQKKKRNFGADMSLVEIRALNSDDRTNGKIHIEFQTEEQGLCARSLEESIMNVNRDYFGLPESITENEIKYKGRSKTDFALNLIYNYPEYEIPEYIRKGLQWLNNEKVLS